MPRKARVAPGGLVYHVLNRAVAKLPLFRKEADYLAFERILIEAHARHPVDILAWCLMKNHWHFVLRPGEDGDLTAFVRWLSHTHAMRWHVSHNTVGGGHLYQGRFKSFPVQDDRHLLTLCRYVERNALAAKLVDRAEQWRFGSLWAREEGSAALRQLLSPWPVDRPRDWVNIVNQPLRDGEMEAIETSMNRGRPYGDARWQSKIIGKLGLEHTVRREGRPEKKK
jgi:REP-associated tyrosine transposase